MRNRKIRKGGRLSRRQWGAIGIIFVSMILYVVFVTRIWTDSGRFHSIMLTCFFMASVVFVLLHKSANTLKVLTIVFFCLSPLAVYWVVQLFAGYSLQLFWTKLWSLYGLLNLLIYTTVLLFVYLVINRVRYTIFLGLIFGVLYGILNYALIAFRGAPLLISDFQSLSTAASVVSGYHLSLDGIALSGLLYALLLCAMVFSLEEKKGLRWRHRAILAILILPLLFANQHIFYKSDFLKNHDISVSIWNPINGYAINGSVLCFAIQVSYQAPQKPRGYSVREVHELMSHYTSDTNESDRLKPNIVIIMNESFSDLSVLGFNETTEPYMPYYDSLSENTIKGNLHVSTIGGLTANTEFEFLTGNTMAFTPYRCVPYNSYISKKTPSLIHTLKAQGYKRNVAIHPYGPTGFHRDRVYPFLGFDAYYSIEDFPQGKFMGNYLSDESNYDFVIEQYEDARENNQLPFLCFNVTIQNHGGYEEAGRVEAQIGLNADDGENQDVVQYVNLIKSSDNALKGLVQYFENIEEPTIIVFFWRPSADVE